MKLTMNEEKLRNLYLRDLEIGKIQGPVTGKASIDKPWLKYYSEEAIKSDRTFDTIYQHISKENPTDSKEIALNYFGKKESYVSMFKHVDEVAKSFIALGVKKGDVVTLCMPNTPEAIYAFFAISKIGAVANLTDPRFTKEELIDCIKDTNSHYVLTLDDFYEKIKSLQDSTNIKNIISVSATYSLAPIEMLRKIKGEGIKLPHDNVSMNWKKFIETGKKIEKVDTAAYEQGKDAVIVYTGGTTGKSKAVILTDDNFTAFVHEYSNVDIDFHRQDKFLNFVPLWTAYGACSSLFMPLSFGMETILVPKTDNSEVANLVMKYKPNHALGIPKTWDEMIKNKKIQNEDLSYLVTLGVGADHMSIDLEDRINSFLKAHGCEQKVMKGYGMTEACSSIATCMSNCNAYDSVGVPLIDNTISVFDPDTEEELPYGKDKKIGEICVMGPTIMKHYLNNEKATKEMIRTHKDGKVWLHTGDLGYIDGTGKVFVVDRIKRMFTRSGFKIFCSLIEDEFSQHLAVDACAAIGMNDDFEGNKPMVHVILRDEYVGQEARVEEELNAIAADKFPQYYMPLLYTFDRELPYTKNGKVDFVTLKNRDNEIEAKKLAKRI